MTESTLSTSEFFERLDSDFYGTDSTRAKDVQPICWQVYYKSYRLLSFSSNNLYYNRRKTTM